MAGPSLLGYFDASVLYEPDNGTPTSAAVGFVVEDGVETHVERSMAVDTVVSSSALEFRALAELVAAVDERFDYPSSLHLHGDADAVIHTVDPDVDAAPSGPVVRRRVETIRDTVASIPVVTYQSVDRTENERAHALARDGHAP